MRRILLLLALAATSVHADSAGHLVIVGGALARDNAAVFRAFIDRVADGSPIAVIGAASGSPASSMERFAHALAHHGVDPGRITPIRLAWRDDPDTATDESAWRCNATDPEQIASIRRAGGIWFTGGDQSRITRVLLAGDGSPTPMLLAMRERLAAGIVIGGTSAGAAVMSDPMVSGGDNLPVLLSSFASLAADDPELPLPQPPTVTDTSVLSMGAGLGFLPGVLVDQHFDARARLGRLAMALLTRPRADRLGLGIDENTGVTVDLAAQRLEVLGAATVTLVDARDASAAAGGVHGLRLSVLAPGSRLDLASVSVTPPQWQQPTPGAERYDQPPVSRAGIATPIAAPLGERLGEDLLDNAGARSVAHLSLRLPSADDAAGEVPGVLYRFAQTPESQGYWGRDGNGDAHYTVVDLTFDIEPVDLTIEPAATRDAPSAD